MDMADTIKGHYVPKFYLRGFTKSDDVYGDLFVLDQRRGRRWESTPNNSACERDMYASEDEGPQKQTLEKAFANAEGWYADAVRETLTTGVVPTGKIYAGLMEFVAALAVRVPRYRDWVDEYATNIMTVALGIQAWTPKQRAAFDWVISRAGIDPRVFALDELQRVTHDHVGGTTVLRSSYLYMLANAAVTLAGDISKRQWELWPCADDAPDLICSDNPVKVDLRPGSSTQTLIGFGTPGTFLSVPLNRRTALVGVLEEPEGGKVLDRELVAVMNRVTLSHASQVYSSEPEFIWYDGKAGAIMNAADLLPVDR
jgi:hypothetical protein